MNGKLLRFFEARYTVLSNGCWQWRTCIRKDGYGMFHGDGLYGYSRLAHRVSYEHFVGLIPPGFTIDHLCRNHSCVNPNHLEAVTRKENVLRGIGHTALNAQKTHCPQGHEYTEENTRRNKDGGRACRSCDRNRKRNLAHLYRRAS